MPANEAALQNARAQNQKTQADLKRVQDLTADGSLSIRERDSAKGQRRAGAADIEQAKATLEMSRQDLQSTIVNRDALEADGCQRQGRAGAGRISICRTRGSLRQPTDSWGKFPSGSAPTSAPVPT
nr:HlyD family secretion protein [Raoultella sp. NCTC 9187]